MISQIPAYTALVLFEPVAYTLLLLVMYVLILNIRRTIQTALRYYDED